VAGCHGGGTGVVGDRLTGRNPTPLTHVDGAFLKELAVDREAGHIENMRSIRLTAVLLLVACGDSTTAPVVPPAPVATSIVLSAMSLSFSSIGATQQLSATVKAQNGATMSGASVSWASSAASVATVSSSGAVTSVADGTATITATSGSASGTAAVTVAIPAPGDTIIAVMVGDSAASSITVGNQLKIPIVVDMSQAVDLDIASLQVKVTWSTSIVSYVSTTAGTFGSLTLNETDVATGTLLANLFNGTGTKESFRALLLTFSGVSAGATAVEVEVTTAGNELGQSLLDKVTTRKHDVTVSN
jgi:hypothetical protein